MRGEQTMSEHIAYSIVAEVADELIERVKAGHNDPMVFLPWAMLTGLERPQQTVTRSFTGRDNPWSYVANLATADELVNRTIERKYVDGIVKSLGWKFNQRKTDDGIEVRPGLAMIIATLGKMPTRKVIVRAAQQGTATQVTVTEYDPKLKALVNHKVG